jgi:hypothetical protein
VLLDEIRDGRWRQSYLDEQPESLFPSLHSDQGCQVYILRAFGNLVAIWYIVSRKIWQP